MANQENMFARRVLPGISYILGTWTKHRKNCDPKITGSGHHKGFLSSRCQQNLGLRPRLVPVWRRRICDNVRWADTSMSRRVGSAMIERQKVDVTASHQTVINTLRISFLFCPYANPPRWNYLNPVLQVWNSSACWDRTWSWSKVVNI